jgi:hypothetical protein
LTMFHRYTFAQKQSHFPRGEVAALLDLVK